MVVFWGSVVCRTFGVTYAKVPGALIWGLDWLGRALVSAGWMGFLHSLDLELGFPGHRALVSAGWVGCFGRFVDPTCDSNVTSLETEPHGMSGSRISMGAFFWIFVVVCGFSIGEFF